MHRYSYRILPPRSALRHLYCVLLLTTAVACASGDDENDNDAHAEEGAGGEFGPPTGATCPTDRSALTYETFGKSFMTTYCTRCHSTTLKSIEARMGAPDGHDFDLLAGISPVYEHIDRKAASGPAATNELMPPASDSGPKPSMAERVKLGQWLACEFGP